VLRARDAQPADALEVAAVHVRSWQVAYRGLIADALLDKLRPEDRAARYTFNSPPAWPQTLLAVDEDDAIRGFATIEPSPDLAGVGELRALYVDPPHWGAGAGRLLIAAACARLCEGGFERIVLWLLSGNEQAARFYRTCGWAPDGARRREEPWGVEVEVQRWVRLL
jgi:GNAT superfamily N-acetyltransferase